MGRLCNFKSTAGGVNIPYSIPWSRGAFGRRIPSGPAGSTSYTLSMVWPCIKHLLFFKLDIDYVTIGRDQIVQVLRHGGIVEG
jgi:hypothetical protein